MANSFAVMARPNRRRARRSLHSSRLLKIVAVGGRLSLRVAVFEKDGRVTLLG
jgi:hypothetical protein